MAEKDESIKKEESETPPETTQNGDTENNDYKEDDKPKAAPCSCDNEDHKKDITVEKLQEQLDGEKDRVLRLSAEFDNYKKRIARETADFKKFANETLFKQLLTVVDNLERAISSGEDEAEKSPILDGVKLTYKDILKIFDNFNVKPVDAEGKPFDPSYHQAITHQESADHPDNTVIKELQKGYLLSDRLIRPSMVIVSKTETETETKTEK